MPRRTGNTMICRAEVLSVQRLMERTTNRNVSRTVPTLEVAAADGNAATCPTLSLNGLVGTAELDNSSH